MTQLESHPSSDVTLENLLRNARDRSARGNATRRDWERVAAIDPDLARRELAEFLRAHANAAGLHIPTNPYARSRRVSGAVLGFVGGVLAVAAIWLALPWIRDTYVDEPLWQHVVTSGQFIATALIPAGIFLGARWGASRDEAPDAPADTPEDASLDELLEAFEKTQHIGHARVY